MAKLTTARKNEMVKAQIVSLLGLAKERDGMVQVGDFKFAFSTEVDGEERWAEVTVVAKNNKATATSDAYDPFQVQEDWEFDKRVKAEKKALADKKKAKKIAKSKSAKKEEKREESAE